MRRAFVRMSADFYCHATLVGIYGILATAILP